MKKTKSKVLFISIFCIVGVLVAFLCYIEYTGSIENEYKAIRALIADKLGYLGKTNQEIEGFVVWDSNEASVDENNLSVKTESKQIKESLCTWPYYEISDAAKTADTIIRGKVLSRSTITKGLPIYNQDGTIYDYDYYREVTVEVVENIKGSEAKETIIYKEPGGETEDYIYRMHDVEPLIIGEEYIFFLYDNNTFLNPSTVIAISDEIVSPSSELLPQTSNGTQTYSTSNGISVDDYIEAIKAELD